MTPLHKYKHIIFLRNPEEPPAWGGLEKLMLDWFKCINFNECEITLGISSHWVDLFKSKLREEQITVKVIALPYGHKQGNILTRFFKLFIFLRKLKPTSVVFMQGWFFSFNLAEVLSGFLAAHGNIYMHENLGSPIPAPKSSKRHFGLIHGLGIWWHIQIRLAMLRACLSKKIMVVSHEIREILISMWHYPASKILVQYHGIDLGHFHPSQEIRQKMRQSLNISPQETVIVAASRLSKVKCIDRTIKAFDILSRQRSDLTLIITGSGLLEENLKALSLSMPCANKILFTGHVDNIYDYFKMSDVYVLSSDNEGFGMALIEAMATGLICVATKCPGPNEIIQDAVNGFLVEKSNEGVLEGLKNALGLSIAEQAKIRERAVRFVSENFELNSRIKNVFDVLGIKCLEGT
ncbi:MAG: glycosyltransferase [Candidatus Omnitrophica bacterium]|nr:glycosyltransferase [Candidatus Omnitrophota bacterium]